MAYSEEDLEFNPFYLALQTRFYSLYEQAQQNCWLVCIPVATSLNASQVTKALVESHLLEPSGFLRDLYKASGHGGLEWRLSQNHLVCANRKVCNMSVRVLSEELGYNRSLQQFKMFILEQPLDPSHKMPSPATTGESSDGGSGGGSPFIGARDLLKRRRSYEEHRSFLESFSRYREGLEELNKQILLFQQHYLVVKVESLLLDTATKLKGIAKQGYTTFITVNKDDSKFNDKRTFEACWLSIEGYLMHHVHSKVYPAILEVHARQDQALRDRCQLLRGKVTPTVLGVVEDYNCPYPSTSEHLVMMSRANTPLEMLYSVQDAIDSVMLDAQRHFDCSFRIGNPQPLASDGLIALMAAIIVQIDLDHVLSMLYYMENFHWSLTDSDQLSYILVTLRAAVEFLRGPDIHQWLPPHTLSSSGPTLSSPATSLSRSDDSDCQTSSLSLSLSTSADLASEESFTSGGSRGGGWREGGGGGGRGGGVRQGRDKEVMSVNGKASLLPGSTLVQALGARLGVSEKEVINTHKLHQQQQQQHKENDMGPFLSRLLENDKVVTSSDYGDC